MRHLWDKINDTCKKCGLKREIRYGGDGYKRMLKTEYNYYFNDRQIKKLPECTINIKSTYDRLFDYSKLKK